MMVLHKRVLIASMNIRSHVFNALSVTYEEQVG
jgi:hypothetical protein